MMCCSNITPLSKKRNAEVEMRIIAVGKLRKTFFRAAFEYYLERAGVYFKIEIIELKKSRYGSRRDIDAALRKEKNQALGRSGNGDYRVVLDERGVELSTRDLIRKLREIESEGHRVVSFFIGGPFGVDGRLRSDADLLMSVSKWTLPHELARVMLMEQLYRCGTLIAGTGYHK